MIKMKEKVIKVFIILDFSVEAFNSFLNLGAIDAISSCFHRFLDLEGCTHDLGRVENFLEQD